MVQPSIGYQPHAGVLFIQSANIIMISLYCFKNHFQSGTETFIWKTSFLNLDLKFQALHLEQFYESELIAKGHKITVPCGK